MSIEELLSKQLAATEKLIAVTEQLVNLRVEGLAKVNEAAAQTAAPKKTTAKAAETAGRQITENPEDRKDPANPEPEAVPAAPAGMTETEMKNVIQAYVTSGSPDPEKDKDEINARKAEVFKLYDIVGAKMEPPREPGKTKLGDIPAGKYSALSARIAKLTEELAAKGGRLVQLATAAADDDL